MKKVLNRTNQRKTIIVLFGIMTGVFVLCTSSFYYQIKSKVCAQEEVVSDQKSSTEEIPYDTSVKAYEALSQIASVNLSLPFLLSFGEVQEPVAQEAIDNRKGERKYIQMVTALFTKVISPNAP